MSGFLRKYYDKLNINGIAFKGFHKRTLDYIKENEEYVEHSNRMMMIRVSMIIMIMLIMYFFLSLTVFASWHVTPIYAVNILINGCFQAFFVLRYLKKKVTARESMIMCTVYQFYIMNFLMVISLSPLEMESPAVYFAPLGIVFAVLFLTPWRWLVIMVTIECAEMIAASYFLKTLDIFSINLFSTLVALFAFIYVAKILYNFRMSESDARLKLKAQAGLDKLTGLYNKGRMENICFDYFNSHVGDVAVMVIDFDNFKRVNDTFGHQQGDQVLKAFGTLLKESVSENDLVGRIGGDEFMIMLTEFSGVSEVERVAQGIVEKTHGILSSEMIFDFSCSIGIALRSQDKNCNYDKLFSNADRAVYQTKKNGKDGMTVYSSELLSEESFRTVMIVEPLKVSRNILVSCLEGKYRLLEANNGTDAIRMLEERGTDLDTIIIDLDPSNSGLQELFNLLASHPTAQEHVVFLVRSRDQVVNYDTKELRVEYIMKPFDTAEVEQRVRDAVV